VVDGKMIQDIDIVDNVIHNACGYIEKNALRRIKARITDSVPFEVLCGNCKHGFGESGYPYHLCQKSGKEKNKQNCPLVGKTLDKENES
jgi:hypothetical protein